MVSLFGKRTASKQPGELVKALRDVLLDKSLSPKKATEEAGKNIGAIRALIHGAGDSEPAELVLLSNEVYSADLFIAIIQNLNKFDFEVRWE